MLEIITIIVSALILTPWILCLLFATPDFRYMIVYPEHK